MFEFSAGGLVIREGTILVIRARDLKGHTVCTFPKGRVDKGETSQQAALNVSP